MRPDRIEPIPRLTVADLFCGTGALSSGFVRTGRFRTVLGVDIKRDAVDTFAANNRKAVSLCEDIRLVRPQELVDEIGLDPGQLDVIVGGPPCQGFSSLRPYRSINQNDHRNTLFEQFLVFVGFFKPRFVVFENVVGLVQHGKGRTLASIVDAFAELGYSTNVRVLNAVHFGVPQKRERVFLLARLGKSRPEFPKPTHWFDGKSMAGGLADLPLHLSSEDLSPAVTLHEAIRDLPPIEAGGSASEYLPMEKASEYGQARRKKQTLLTLHQATRHTKRMLAIIRKAGRNRWALPDGMTTSGFSSCYSRLADDEPSTTLTVNFVHPASNRCIHPVQDRALTPREGARLQGFDDDFEFCGTRTQVVKQIGEAVPPVLSHALALTILDQLD